MPNGPVHASTGPVSVARIRRATVDYVQDSTARRGLLRCEASQHNIGKLRWNIIEIVPYRPQVAWVDDTLEPVALISHFRSADCRARGQSRIGVAPSFNWQQI